MDIEYIKHQIKRLRELRVEDETKASEELRKFRLELQKVGLTIFWCSEEDDYAIYCNEE